MPIQSRKKEIIYLQMLNNIISSINNNIDIVFDTFHKHDFEQRIIKRFQSCDNVLSIESSESFKEPGIQYVDNLCSVIRLSYLKNKNEYYTLISDKTMDVSKKKIDYF